MKNLLTVLVVLVIAVFVAPASAEVTTNVSTPINATVFVPCANGGAGEAVELSGDLHTLVSVTINKNTVSGKTHSQPQGVSGVGLVTGDRYQGTGVTQTQFSAQLNGDQVERTFVNNFRIIGQGPGNNVLVHTVTHITVNANGDVTADVSIGGTECK